MRERNTSQLPRLLCCTMERERDTGPASGEGGEERVSSISGPSPDHQVRRERGWGAPGGAGRQHLEWVGQRRGEQRGDWSGGLTLRRQGGGGEPWGGGGAWGFRDFSFVLSSVHLPLFREWSFCGLGGGRGFGLCSSGTSRE